MEEDPELLEVIIRDDYLFLSTAGLPLERTVKGR